MTIYQHNSFVDVFIYIYQFFNNAHDHFYYTIYIVIYNMIRA